MSAENIVRRLKPIDYGALEESLKQKKTTAAKTSNRVKEIKSVSVQIKDKKLLQQHVMVWSQEFLRLNSMNKKCQSSLDKYHMDAVMESDSKILFSELLKLGMQLDAECEEFKKSIIDPTVTLREDLKFYIHSKRNGDPVGSPEAVKTIIHQVKQGLQHSWQQLYHEEKALLDEIEHDSALRELVPTDVDDVVSSIHTGIPDDAWDIEAPTDEMKIELLGEFILLDEFYQRQWENLRKKYNHIVQRDFPNTWREQEVTLFETILDGYRNFCMVNRHTLVMDVMRQLFPTRKRAELLSVDSWLEDKRVLTLQTRSLVHDWIRSRHELTNRIKVTLEDAMDSSFKAQQKQETIEAQKHICLQLSNQVRKWREEKEEMTQLQQQFMQEEVSKLKLEEKRKKEAEKNEREKKKNSIQAFKDKKEEEIANKKRTEEARLAQLREQLAQQALYDKERVNYRKDLVQQKQEEFQEKMLQQQEIQLEQEKRLEELRKTVRPDVQNDPQRVLLPTKAWEIHTKKGEDEEDEEDLFTNGWATKFDLAHFPSANNLHTFTEKQLRTDQRYRVETALREAGLMHSDYARNIIRQLPAAQPTRKDNQLSTNIDFLKYS